MQTVQSGRKCDRVSFSRHSTPDATELTAHQIANGICFAMLYPGKVLTTIRFAIFHCIAGQTRGAVWTPITRHLCFFAAHECVRMHSMQFSCKFINRALRESFTQLYIYENSQRNRCTAAQNFSHNLYLVSRYNLISRFNYEIYVILKRYKIKRDK